MSGFEHRGFIDLGFGKKINDIPVIPPLTTSTSTSTTPSPFSAEYQLVYDAMTNKPSYADAINQDTMLNSLVAGGYYAKAEFLDVLCVHTNAANEALINWHNPGTFNPSAVNAPLFTAYEGFTGNSAGAKYIRSNFTPSVDGTIIGQNNICAIIGVGNDVQETRNDFGGLSQSFVIRSRNTDDTAVYWCNNASGSPATTANLNGKKYYAISRGAAANYDTYINLVKVNKVVASSGLSTSELAICGSNNVGVFSASNRQLRFAFVFSYLTEVEVQGVIGIMNTYLTNYGTNLY